MLGRIQVELHTPAAQGFAKVLVMIADFEHAVLCPSLFHQSVDCGLADIVLTDVDLVVFSGRATVLGATLLFHRGNQAIQQGM